MTSRRRTRPAAFAALCSAALCGTMVLAAAAACTPDATADGPARAHEVVAPPPTYPATVSVSTAGAPVGQLGDDYIGLSFESGRLNTGRFDDKGDLAQMLRNLGTSVLRLGGNSVDQGFAGASPAELSGLRRLADASGWNVLYSENLGHFRPATVTSDARAVASALGGRLAAFACGNEPNLYRGNGLRSRSYTEAGYLAEVARCYDAIRAGAPGAPLEGPDSSGAPKWLRPYADAERGEVNWLGAHEYPLGCHEGSETPAQMAANLLSPELNAQEVSTFTAVTRAAGAAGARPLITETSSDCGGSSDRITYSYATALWVIDYLLTGAEHGVTGMYFHGGLVGGCTYYTPLCRAGGDEYTAQPIYYGMLLTHMLGTGSLLPVTVSSGSPSMRVRAFALRPDSGGLRIIVENMSPDNAAVDMRVSSTRTAATMLTLKAPSLLATSGVRIQGASVDPNGHLNPGRPSVVACMPGACNLTLPPYSAGLLSVAG